MNETKRENIILEQMENQATGGLQKITDYIENKSNGELSDDVKRFLIQHADHYMNIVQYMEDFKEHYLNGKTLDCPNNCDDHDEEYRQW